MTFTKRFAFLILLFSFSNTWSQEYKQTVRGTLVDFDLKVPIPDAKIVILNSQPIQGTYTNDQGEFRIEDVAVGRVDIKISAYGYQDMFMQNILIESGKEKTFQLEMQAVVQEIKTIEVKAQCDPSEAINKMATVSSKTFTVEETNRYSGSINDPARMVTGFAGVAGDAEGDNSIVVRGNSPRGILWRLDGIDIPNPNHFAGEGSTGGPVNSLNGSMLANSDFFSGAFAPEYGNALSGVFDVRFRQGNNEKREYSFSAGVIGLDGTLEGPLKKGYRGSYLINYRYSSISLLDKLGILDFNGIPIYQDLSFNFFLPTKRLGNFSVVGLGGISSIDQTDENDTTGYIYERYLFKANVGVAAIKHSVVLNPKVYLKSYIAATTASNGGEGSERGKTDLLYLREKMRASDNKLKAQSILNFKPNNKNIYQLGLTYTHLNFSFLYEEDQKENGTFSPLHKSSGNSDMIESFFSWKHHVNNKLSVVSGLHYTQLFLNNNQALEPRLGVKWQSSNRSNLSFGIGMHSRLESISTYQYNELQSDGSYQAPNRNLDFSKSVHYVLGYGLKLNENLRLKSEVYFQYLYNIPVENDPFSSISLTNSSEGIPEFQLVNEGTGRNYGIELTLDRHFGNNFYYLLTSSFFKSEYKAMDGIMRNSRFDANYLVNALGGKEFKFGKGRNKTIGINSKISFLGANRFTPIDLQASVSAKEEVLMNDQPFSEKGENIFILNLGLTYRVDRKKTSHSFKIDIQNVTNNQAVIGQYYNVRMQKIEKSTQLPLIPNLIYTIKF